MPIMWWHIMVAVVGTPLAYQLAYRLLRDDTPPPTPLRRTITAPRQRNIDHHERHMETLRQHERHMETLRQCFESAGHPVPSMEEAGHNRRIQAWGGEQVHLL